MLKVQDRTLLQLRLLASFNDGIPKADAERYTLLWIEKGPAESGMKIRSHDGKAVKEKGPVEVKQLLEDTSTDWNELFGEASVFRKLKDK